MDVARNEDTQSFAQVQEDGRSVVTESSITSHQTSMTIRRARVSNPEERTTDELSKQILSEMEKQIQERKNAEPREKNKALYIVRKVFEDTEQALDVAFAVRVFASKTEAHAQEESLKFSSSLPECQMKKEISKVKKRLSNASMLITELLNIEYKDEEIPADTNSFL